MKKNIKEGKSFQLLGEQGIRGGTTTYEFASSNELWRATLDTIDFMPLTTANYSGGIVVTDWYSDNQNSNESIKISIRFLTNEIRSDAIKIKTFYKTTQLLYTLINIFCLSFIILDYTCLKTRLP